MNKAKMDRPECEPSEEEKAMYYRGLPSMPRLIARTSCTPWSRPGVQYRCRWKQFRAIGDRHIIVEKWSESVVKSLIRALDGHDWRSFYPIRIGYTAVDDSETDPEDDSGDDENTHTEIPDDCPVVLLVSLAEAGLDWAHAIELALACRAVLRDAGIENVEVELLEAEVIQLGSVPAHWECLLDDQYWPLPTTVAPRDANADTFMMLPMLFPFGSGSFQPPIRKTTTVRVHLQLGGDESKTYGLADRHAAIDGRLSDSVDYRCPKSTTKGGDESRLEIANPFSALRNNLENLQITQSKFSDSTAPPLSDYGGGHLVPLDRAVKCLADFARAIEGAAAPGSGATRKEKVSKPWHSMGHVAFSPKLEVHAEHGFLRDWALIELDPSRLPNGPENMVYVGNPPPPASSEELDFASPAGKDADLSDFTDKDGLLHVHGFRPLPTDNSGRRAYRVVKRGVVSGLTFGVVGEIEATLREPTTVDGVDGQKKDRITSALYIVSHKTKGGYPGPPFSYQGDSGSCVFDYSGVAMGILNAGQTAYRAPYVYQKEEDVDEPPPLTTEPESFDDNSYGASSDLRTEPREVDVTFATPIQWVLDDIEAFTGKKPVIV